MVQIFYDDLGDWVTLYVDGAKKLQGHSLDVRNVLKVLGIPYETRHTDDLTLYGDKDRADDLENAICNLPDDVAYLNKHLREDKQFTVD